MNFHFASAVAPGTRLVVAIAPAFTIGFVRPSGLRSTPASELNGRPVAFAPSFWRACSAPMSLANQGEDERLRHAHDREFMLGRAHGVNGAVGADHANAEQIARYFGQGRIDLRIRAVGV